MRPVTGVRLRNELLLINLCSAVLIVIIWLVDIWALRLVLGLPFLLFFPGYTLISALFPARSDLGTIQRITLSIVFSIIASAAAGFAMNFLWELSLYPVLAGVSAFTAVMSCLAWVRRRRVPQDERLEIVLASPFGRGGRFSALDKVVSLVLVLAFLAAMVTLVAVVANPGEGERYSGFYIRGAQSRPAEVTAGQPTVVTLGITNHEAEAMTYRIEVRAGDNLLKTTDPVSLPDGGTWENEVAFVPDQTCAATELAQDLNVATDNTPATPAGSIQVVSVQNLAPGDRIWVGQESAVVKAISGNTVDLAQELKQPHLAGTEVMEVLRIDFRLVKVRQIGGQAGTSLSLWVGKEHLQANILNLGQKQAAYQVTLDVRNTHREGAAINSPVQNVPAGQSWTAQADYAFSENNEVLFSLYRDGSLAYQRLEPACYPTLFLWVHVR